MRTCIVILALFLPSALLSGCLTDKVHDNPDGEGAFDQGSGSPILMMEDPVQVGQGMAGEPMILETPNRDLYITGHGSEFTPAEDMLAPSLWRSTDGGTAWSTVDVGAVLDGAVGWADMDLAVASDGTIYFTAMAFVFGTCPAAVEGCPAQVGWEGIIIPVGTSTDDGDSWTWTPVAFGRSVDRPWVEVAPDGTAHIIWNDADGVHHASSSDQGESWQEGPLVHDAGGSSSLAISPTGELVVRVTPGSANGRLWDPAVDGIAVSLDGGNTWNWYHLPGQREARFVGSPEQGVPRWVEPVAFDDAGMLYAAWSERTHMIVAMSSDLGQTWTLHPLPAHHDTAYYPFMVARGIGESAITWFTGPLQAPVAHVALVLHDNSDFAVVSIEYPLIAPAQDAPTGHGEYFGITFLQESGLGIVNTIPGDLQGTQGGFEFRVAQASSHLETPPEEM